MRVLGWNLKLLLQSLMSIDGDRIPLSVCRTSVVERGTPTVGPHSHIAGPKIVMWCPALRPCDSITVREGAGDYASMPPALLSFTSGRCLMDGGGHRPPG